MKERIANISAIILVLLSVIETVVVAIFRVDEWYFVVLSELIFIAGVCFVRFPYQIASRRNATHALFYKKNPDASDKEPSKFAVNSIKFLGYFSMFFAVIFFLFAAILY